MRKIITLITALFSIALGNYPFSVYGQTPAELDLNTYQPAARATQKITIRNGFSVPAGQQFVGEIVPPDMPPVPTITFNCGSSILTTPAPPAGIIYYFQTTATGESTTGTSPFTVNVSNTYFLRARTNGGSWGEARPIIVNVNPIPADPAGPPVITSNGEDIAILTAPAAPSGFTYYFQMSVNGKDTFRQSPFTATESGTYYLRSRHNLSDCWSVGVTSVVVTIVASDPISLDPDEARNYITENTILVPGKLTVSDLQNLTIQNLSQQTTFFDGLGRPIQSVNTQASPTRKDMVMPMDYDQYGRPNRAYLPFAQGEDGKFKPNALKGGNQEYTTSNQYAFYQNTPDIANDTKPFAKTIYDNSPLDFALGQGSVGKVWNPTEEQGDGKIVTSTYRRNETGDNVRWLVYNHTSDGSIGSFSSHSTTPNYPVGRLMVSEMKDEDNNTVLQFTNKSGQVIMKRALLSSTDYLDTYYIYDDFGLLRYVLPPKLVEIIQANNWQASASQLNQYVYHYTYDKRKRVVEKKVPGASVVYMVYNRRDELILSQDGNQRAGNDNRWTFTKYDILGRPVITGEYNAGIDTKATLQTAANAHVLQHETHSTTALPYYTDQAYPVLSGKTYQINTITYYDEYDFDNNGSSDRAYNINFQDQFTETSSQKKPNPVYGHDGKLIGTRGLVTGTYTRNAHFEGPEEQWLKTVIFYDDRERPVQVQADNHIGGIDITTTQYHFDGRVVKSYLRHQTNLDATRPQVAVSQWEDYDHARRVTASYQQIDNEPVERMAVYSYNELSQLTSKQVGHTTRAGATTPYLQKIDFSYTIRGWLNKINNTTLDATGENDQFGMELTYNLSGTTATSYNGNITGYSWKSATDGVARAYAYKYDALGRLLKANFTGASGEDFSLYGNSADGQENISYDKNGNILTLHRKGLVSYDANQNPQYGVIDALRYNYEGRGNQLLFIDDDAPVNTGLAGDFQDVPQPEDPEESVAEYSFDNNGNQLKDDNKKIEGITYNYLDLPTLIQYEGGNQIEYFYDGAGSVLRKIVTMSGTAPKTIDYAGSFVYEDNQLQLIHTPEGRALTPQLAQSTKFVYEYQYSDHQGNLRMLFREGNTIKHTATMETENAIVEELKFDNMTTTRVQDAVMSCTSDESAKIDPAKNQTLGPWKTILVRRGDKIRATARGRYDEPATNTRNSPLEFYLTALNPGNYPATNPEAGNSYPLLRAGITLNPTIPNRPLGKPKAYIKYMFYDKQGHYILPEPEIDDYDAISGAEDVCEDLEINFTADKDGSIQVFVANESDMPVWFDDIEITHVQALTVQEKHYDPFGLSLAGIEKWCS